MGEHDEKVIAASAAGKPEPLGSAYDGRGTNFSVFSSVAREVELCLFDDSGVETRIALPGGPVLIFTATSSPCGRASGTGFGSTDRGIPPKDTSAAPKNSCSIRTRKRSTAPFDGTTRFSRSTRAARRIPSTAETRLRSFRNRSSSITSFDWKDDRRPKTPLEHTILYEVHVKGFTVRHPAVAPELRGTYAGLGSPASIEHLQRLGVTAIELLPVQQFIHRRHLVAAGLRNYWGYDPVAFFAPHNEYAADKSPGGAVREFKEMVRSLHSAGIEVILDVVFNHTGEGGTQGRRCWLSRASTTRPTIG